MKTFDNVIDLLGRLFISVIFLVAGINKISAFSATQQYMESVNVPGVLLPGVIFVEVIGALMIMLGFKTHIAAYVLAIFCISTALIFHLDFSSEAETIMFMKNFALAGGFLMIASHGIGDISLDKQFRSVKDGGIDG